MKLCNSIRRGAARASSIVRRPTVRRFLPRLVSRRDWILYSPLIVLVTICIIATTSLLHYAIVCELPTSISNAIYHRCDETEEFWPNSLRSEVASSIVNNVTVGGQISIQLQNFTGVKISFLENSIHPCASSEKNDIIILIKTSLKGKSQRERLRKSWANESFLSRFSARVKYAFIIGNPGVTLGREERTDVDEEIARYQDFIIGDFKDVYRSLIFKVLMSLQWTQEFCPNYEFILIIDDDFDVYLESLVNFLRDPGGYPHSDFRSSNKIFSKLCHAGCQHFYAGYIMPHYYTPNRNKEDKMFLTKEEYPPEVFPLYVTGLMIILSKKTATSMNQLTQFMPRISIEDVYLGLLARKLKIKPFGINHLMITKFNWVRLIFDFWKTPEVAIGRTDHTFGCD